MPSRKQSQPENGPQMTIEKSSEFRSFYVNWLNGAFSPFDINLAIGQSRATGPNSLEVDHEANIVMSPLEAKVAVAMLSGLIQAYENNFGEVKIPKAMEAQFAMPFPSVQMEKKIEDR